MRNSRKLTDFIQVACLSPSGPARDFNLHSQSGECKFLKNVKPSEQGMGNPSQSRSPRQGCGYRADDSIYITEEYAPGPDMIDHLLLIHFRMFCRFKVHESMLIMNDLYYDIDVRIESLFLLIYLPLVLLVTRKPKRAMQLMA